MLPPQHVMNINNVEWDYDFYQEWEDNLYQEWEKEEWEKEEWLCHALVAPRNTL